MVVRSPTRQNVTPKVLKQQQRLSSTNKRQNQHQTPKHRSPKNRRSHGLKEQIIQSKQNEFSNSFEALHSEQDHQLVSTNDIGRRTVVPTEVGTQYAAQAHSSNAPTLQFCSPYIEEIIKETQKAMMLSPILVKQPLVTLNTSVFEVPSQLEKSCGELEGEPGQIMLTSGFNSSVVQPSLRDIVSKSRRWDEQHEEDEEEKCGIEDSTDDDIQESADEDMRSIGSPPLPRNDGASTSSLKSNLNYNVPIFFPLVLMLVQ